jgi:hypothetical protein
VETLGWVVEQILPDVLMFGGLAALTVGLWGWDWRVALGVLGVLGMGIAVWHEMRGAAEEGARDKVKGARGMREEEQL